MVGAALFKRFLDIHGTNNFTESIVHTFTIWVLLFFTILLSSKMMFGDLLVCLMPPELPSTWVKYFHSYCFYQDKYRTNDTDREIISRSGTLRLVYRTHDPNHFTKETITYYQWIPYTLLLQIFLCLLPAIFWKHVGLRMFHGSDINTLLKTFKGDGTVALMEEENFNKLSHDFHRLLRMKKCDKFGMHSTMLLYVAAKWISVISFFVQFSIMAELYADGVLLWGVHMAYDLFQPKTYNDMYRGFFPRMVMCDVDKMEMGGIHKRSLNCLLSQNFINEKAYLFLYWWFVFVSIVSIFSAIRFTLLLMSPSYQRYTTKSLLPTQEYFLECSDDQSQLSNVNDNDLMEYFVDYLGSDGFLMLQLVCDTLTVMTVRRLSKKLWCAIIVRNDDLDYAERDDLNATAPPITEQKNKNAGEKDKEGSVMKRKKAFGNDSFDEPLIGETPSSSERSSPATFSKQNE